MQGRRSLATLLTMLVVLVVLVVLLVAVVPLALLTGALTAKAIAPMQGLKSGELDPGHMRELVGKFGTVIRATVKGNLGVALVQGALGGLAVFGITDLVIGPLIAAMYIAVWHIHAVERLEAPPPAETTASACDSAQTGRLRLRMLTPADGRRAGAGSAALRNPDECNFDDRPARRRPGPARAFASSLAARWPTAARTLR